MSFVATCLDVETVTVSEVSQTKTYHMTAFTLGIEKK